MSAKNVMAAACSILVIVFGCIIYVIVAGPIFTTMLPVFETNTPLYWFNYLHGGMIVWICQLVYVLIFGVAALGAFNLISSAFKEQDYDQEY
jgi:hypothetical protein